MNREKKAIRDYYSYMNAFKEEGLQQGLEQGLQQGLQQGTAKRVISTSYTNCKKYVKR